jgi:SAM-dependent methyltransferase
VLELGCGTGRLLLRLLASGVDAYGLDISPKMVSRLQKKAKGQGITAKGRARVADMRSFTSKRKYALVIVPFRVFLHLLTSDDQIAALKCIRSSLAPGGRAILNFFLPSPHFIAANYGRKVSWIAYSDRAIAKRDKKLAKKDLQAVDFTRYEDEPGQLIRVSQSLYRGKKRIAKYDFCLSLVYKREFELLLRLSGFSKWEVCGGFKKEKLVSSKQEMVWEISR